MYRVAVLEPASGQVADLICGWFRARGGDRSIALTRGAHLGAFSGGYDLFVLASSDGGAVQERISCRALLTCVETFGILSKWVVGYGLSVRDSLTVSSLGPNQTVLALQRELVTLDGTVIEQQELPLPIPPGAEAESMMALYGSLLILGVPPEALAN